MATKQTNERRLSHRHAASRAIRYRMMGDIHVEHLRDISKTGAYINCREPLPLGTALLLEFHVEESSRFQLEAKVVRVVWGGRQDGVEIEPGMALQFQEISQETLNRLLLHSAP